MKDTYRHIGMRQQLIDNLREKGIKEERVLEAMNQIPRHFFMDMAFEEHAYEDKPFSIGEDQTISQPFTVAFQTQLLEVQKRNKILEIGTGSGYQAAVLDKLGGRVFTIERIEKLHIKAKKVFEILGLKRIRPYFRDGHKGLLEMAPYDRILVTAGAPIVPEQLKLQLTIGGILVIPVGGIEGQKMLKILRVSETEFVEETHGNFRFVPFLEGTKSK